MSFNGKIRAVIIGFAHMHVNEVAKYISDEEDMILAAAADTKATVPEVPKTRYTRAWNKENIRENYCNVIYPDGEYCRMLDEVKPDIAFILTETARKPEVVKACADRGVSVSIEKPMAVSFEEALKIEKDVKESGIFAMVNWPLTWRPYLHTMKKALDDGKIGKLIKLRFLIGNTGPVGKGALHRGVTERVRDMSDSDKASMWWYRKSEGGGALLDFCCYGCMLSNWITKESAVAVTANAVNTAHPFADIYDNAAALVDFPSWLAVLEGTWTTPSRAIPAGPTILGTDGVIECRREGDKVVPYAFDIYGNDIEIKEAPYPEYLKNIAAMYVHHVKTGEPVHETLDFGNNMRVMAILDAAARSAESGRKESVKRQ